MKAELKKKTITLKSGEVIAVRPLTRKDASALLAFYRNLPEEDRQFLDDNVTHEDWVDRYMDRMDFDTRVPIVAELQGAIIGHATLIRTHYGWMSHVGQLRIAVSRNFQHKGLGSLLLKEVTKIAVGFGLEVLTARLMDNQVSARHAFERRGFKVDAIIKSMVKDIYGKRRDLVLMSNDVSHIWQAMDALVSDAEPTRESLV